MKNHEKEMIINDNELSEYIPLYEVEKILEMTNFSGHLTRSSILSLVIRKISIDRRLLFHSDDVNRVLSEAILFFELHYTCHEVMQFKEVIEGKLNIRKVTTVTIPNGFSLILSNTRFPGGEYKRNRAAYKKDDINYILQELKEPSADQYISITEAAQMLDMDSLGNTDIRNSLKTLNIRKVSRSNKLFFHVDDVKSILNEAMLFFEKHYAYHEVMGFKNVTEGKLQYSGLTKIAIPFGFNAVLANRRFPDGGYRTSRSAYRKDDVNNILPEFGKRTFEQYSSEGLSDDELKEYLPIDEVSKILGMENLPVDVIRDSIRGFNFKQIMKVMKKYYYAPDIYKLLDKVKEFFENHYTRCEMENIKKTTSRIIGIRQLTKVRMPPGYNAVLYGERYPGRKFETNIVAFKKDEVNNVGNTFGYITLREVLDATNFPKNHFNTIVRNSFNIRTMNKKTLFSEDDVNELIVKQREFLSEYTDAMSSKEKYAAGFTINFKDLNVYDAPYYAITKDNCMSITKCKGVFKISEIQEYIDVKVSNKVNTDISGATSFETFTYRLDVHIKWNGFNKASKYTEEKWYKYVKNYLENTITKGGNLSSNINKFVRCTFLVKEMLERNNKTEIYLLTSNEMNLFLRGTVLAFRKAIYAFLKEVYSDLLAVSDLKNRGFKISELVEPPRTLPKSKENKDSDEDSDNVIYDFAVYSEVFKYQRNNDLHTKKCIEEIEKKGTATYASVWLYGMLHLNNAWRNGDVRDFPRLTVEDLMNDAGIINIEWFKSHKIELPLARAIIHRVIQWEFIISKTQMKGRFFCTDELAPSISTAIIILTLFNNGLLSESAEGLMKFNTKFNDVSKSMLQKFFAELNCKDFIFGSKKFNKSIMTYIAFLANMSGDEKSIEYAKWMRGHKHIGSTLHYIDFNIESVDEISRMLFARGEFGYVTSLLLNRLKKGEIGSFEEVTEEVHAVNRLFGDADKVNTTLAFLNSVRADRELVHDYLSTKSFQECQEIATDLFVGNLTSKAGSDVQCLHSKTGCQRIDLYDEDEEGCGCFECPFHIPSIYTLSTLCESLKRNIAEYNDAQNRAKKFKFSLKINRKKVVLLEAISKFGKDYVYGCLGMPREEFLDILSEFTISSRLNLL